MDELKKVLESVDDCYEDFVVGVMSAAEDDEDIEKIIVFIKENDEVTTSDVIEYLDELGI
jgi:hypothetical protein